MSKIYKLFGGSSRSGRLGGLPCRAAERNPKATLKDTR